MIVSYFFACIAKSDTFPSVATMVQAGLGMKTGFAYDVQAVCAGFIYALANANAQIIAGQAKRILVVGAESFSKLMDWTDRGTCVLFGDGAGALVLEAEDGKGDKGDRGVLAVDLNSDGSYRDILYVDGGVSHQTTGHLRMHGKEVFRHAVEKLAQTAEAAMKKAVEHTTSEFTSIRTGKASPALVENLDVHHILHK